MPPAASRFSRICSSAVIGKRATLPTTISVVVSAFGTTASADTFFTRTMSSVIRVPAAMSWEATTTDLVSPEGAASSPPPPDRLR